MFTPKKRFKWISFARNRTAACLVNLCTWEAFLNIDLTL